LRPTRAATADLKGRRPVSTSSPAVSPARPGRSRNPLAGLRRVFRVFRVFSPWAWREWLNEPASEEEMTITEHLAELRSRLFWAVAAIILGTVIAFGFSRQLMELVLAPLPPEVKVVTLGITEGFFTQMKVALYAGIIIAMPMIVYQIGAFIAPALQPNEKGWLLKLVPGATIMFLLGVVFSYFVILPTSVQFLLTFLDPQYAEAMPQLERYLSFATRMILAIGITFEVPVFIWFLSKLGIVNAAQLAGARRYAIVVVAVLAAIITPTGDPLNMALVAVPGYLLFEFGILLAKLS
jgi:sec-independent protein translocase protein TatC